ELRKLLNFRDSTDFELQAVTFVSKELTGLNNTFTIDAGSKKGMALGMPVVTSDGLIGKVVLTSENYSQVMPYFNNLFKVSARVQQSRSTGIVSWLGNDMSELVMDYVPKTIRVEP